MTAHNPISSYLTPEDMDPRLGTYLWRGNVYHGRAAVAAAAGVAECTITAHLARHGHLENLGVTEGTHPLSKPFEVRGKRFPSYASFARLVGISRTTVKKWHQKGREDLLQGCVERFEAGRSPDNRVKALEVAGRTWPSVAGFARYVDCHPQTVRSWIKKGDTERMESALIYAEARKAEVQA